MDGAVVKICKARRPWNDYRTLSTRTKLKLYDQIINARFRSVKSSFKYILPNKLYAPLFTAVQQMINNMLNSIHSTLTPSTIFKRTRIDLNFQKIVLCRITL
jgi:hypothetical protein